MHILTPYPKKHTNTNDRFSILHGMQKTNLINHPNPTVRDLSFNKIHIYQAYVESSSLAISGTVTLAKRVLAKILFPYMKFLGILPVLSQSQRETRGPSFQLPLQIAKGQLLFGPLKNFITL